MIEENCDDFSVLGYSQANGFLGDFLELSLRVRFGVSAVEFLGRRRPVRITGNLSVGVLG